MNVTVLAVGSKSVHWKHLRNRMGSITQLTQGFLLIFSSFLPDDESHRKLSNFEVIKPRCCKGERQRLAFSLMKHFLINKKFWKTVTFFSYAFIGVEWLAGTDTEESA